jgi:nitrate reductase assembly molybdenum cofactor insertion protein NarJ
MTEHETYDELAELLYFPRTGYHELVARAVERLSSKHLELVPQLKPFAEAVPQLTLTELQEIHTRTFDVQSITSLDVGYVLFGEDYKRGELLAHLSREHRCAGIECEGELGDHLPNVLRLLGRLSDRVLVDELVRELLAPALRRMIAEFDRARIAQKDAFYQKQHKTVIECSTQHRDVFRYPLLAVDERLRCEFDLPELSARIEQTSSFLASITSECQVDSCEGNQAFDKRVSWR